jgi:hypothetical protein
MVQDKSVEQAVTIYTIVHVDTTFDHPVEKVWPYLLHWNEWIDDYAAPHKQFVYRNVSPRYVYDALTGKTTEVPFVDFDSNTVRTENGKVVYSLDVFGEY